MTCLRMCLLMLMLSSAASAAEDRLNVILIVADDLGARDLGCYGSQFHRTPALDALAEDGVRFTQSYAACPVCSPTRAAIMSGKYPARLHLTDWLPGRGDRTDQRLNRPQIRQGLPLDEVTIAELFRDAGYTTGHIGKWHLGGAGFGPLDQGFQTNLAGDDKGSPLSYFAPFARGGRTMPGLESAEPGEYLTDRLNQAAVTFIEENAKKPFFLYLPHFAVHTPLNAKEELVQQFPAATPFEGRQNNPVYAAMLLSLDQGIQKIRNALRKQDLSNRTLIVFTSDNGGLATVEGPRTPATSNAPLREGKGWLYEGGIRVPLIFAGPMIGQRGRTSNVLVSSQDLLPTICELAELPIPENLDGISVATTIRDKSTDESQPSRTLFWHYPHYSNQGGHPGGAVRHDNFKWIEFYDSGRKELYDLNKDPRESRNLIAEMPEVAERLEAELSSWRKAVKAQEMTPNPQYVPNPQDERGIIVLPARTAEIQGLALRYEPLPHKNTLGFWTRVEDSAEWEFEVRRPGSFRMEAFVGCGKGSGGSRVVFQVANQEAVLDVPETGGFQKFVPRNLGVVKLSEARRYRLKVVPQSKPGAAVMDLQQVVLSPVTE